MDLTKYNNHQVAAISAKLGPILVIAGAGSGKTQVLTARFEYLVSELGFNVNNILAITFTNKAANEMKNRLYKKLSVSFIPWVGTFHGICLRILREDINAIGRANNFSIIDDDDQLAIFKEAYKLYNLNSKDLPYKQIFHLLEKYQLNKMHMEDMEREVNWDFLKIKNLRDLINKKRVIEFYLNYCEKNNLLCFNDLLILTNKVLDDSEILKKWQDKFNYVLIDEFQDTNDEQYELIKKLTKQSQNVFAVGDPDQMIYSWRGANESIFESFRKDYDDTKLIVLDINYRSNQEILDASNNLIKNNFNRIDKNLIAHQGYIKTKPLYYQAKSQDQESSWVVNKIQTLLASGINKNEIAVLYRSNYLSRNIEQALIKANIEYKIFGSVKFYQRKEIKDILAYLKAAYLTDELSIKRILNTPRRGISQNSIDIITKYAIENNMSFVKALFDVNNIQGLTKVAVNGIKEFNELFINLNLNQSMLKLFDEILEKTKYEVYLKENEEGYRMENIMELRNSIIEFEKSHAHGSFVEYLQEISLDSDEDSKKSNESVSLMTIHIAKGLEFNYVFVIGLNEDIFPTNQAIKTENINEERRIAYVAITRAKKQLFLSSFEGVNYMYNSVNRKSRFIDEISNKFYDQDYTKVKVLTKNNEDDWYDSTQSFSHITRNNNFSNKYDFKVGDQVVHVNFGMGYVLEKQANVLTIYFVEYKRKILIDGRHISLKRVYN